MPKQADNIASFPHTRSRKGKIALRHQNQCFLAQIGTFLLSHNYKFPFYWLCLLRLLLITQRTISNILSYLDNYFLPEKIFPCNKRIKSRKRREDHGTNNVKRQKENSCTGEPVKNPEYRLCKPWGICLTCEYQSIPQCPLWAISLFGLMQIFI